MTQKDLITAPIIILMVLFSILTNTYAQKPEEEAYNKGVKYYHKKMFDEAISQYNKAIEIKPKYWQAHYNRGSVYGAKGDFDQAISDYSKTIEINPKFAEAY